MISETPQTRSNHGAQSRFRNVAEWQQIFAFTANTPLPARSPTSTEGPFGELLRATGPMAKVNPFRFSTKYQDDETDLLYYGYRYYSASTGRWISRDPIGEQSGPGLYLFSENDGINKRDYLGWMVGSVKVLKNRPLSALLTYGWEIELEWRPPLEWNDTESYCAPCRRAVWIQDRKYAVEYRWPWGPDIHTGWGVDWDESDFSGSAYEWIAGRGAASKNSWMHDEPQVGPSFRVKDVFSWLSPRLNVSREVITG